MRRIAVIILTLVLGALAILSAYADKPRNLPAPRWRVSLDPLFGNHPDETHVTSVGNIVFVSHYPAVIAVDRTTGRELWRRGDFDAESVKVPRTRTGWQLSSCANVEGVGPVALLLRIRETTTHDSTLASGERSAADYSEEALNAATGEVIWRSPANVYCTSTLVGGLVVSINSVEAQDKIKALRHRDAATGTAIDETDTQGRAAIQRAVQRQAKNPVLISNQVALWSLNLGAGIATNLHNATGYLISAAAFPHQERIVMYNDADADATGQSSFPKYVECIDLAGANQWSFPKDLQFITADKIATIPELYSLLPMTPCRTCGTLLCVSDKAGRNGKFCWYGIDVRDGKILWKSAVVDEPPVAAECGTGFLVIAYRNTAAGKVSLEWMSGRTGKLTRIGQAPNAAIMTCSGSDLLVVDPSGNLVAYSLDAILPIRGRL